MSVPRTLQMNHVLIVDDNEEMTDLMVRILETFGPDRMTLYIANDPLTIRVPLEVDLVIADYNMPGATGVEVIEGVRRIHPDVRAIMVTGYADVQIAAEAVNRARVDHFLTKPFDPEELVAVVAEILAEKRTADLRSRSFDRAQRLIEPSD